MQLAFLTSVVDPAEDILLPFHRISAYAFDILLKHTRSSQLRNRVSAYIAVHI